MSNRGARLDTKKLAMLQSTVSNNRGRSRSPSKSGNNSRSSSASYEENKELKWSITSHDPSERLRTDSDARSKSEDSWESEVSEEEHISDDDTNEKFQYDTTGNILPNYACHEDKINRVASILENSNLNDRETVKDLEKLTASERAFANAKTIGNDLSEDALRKLENEKQTLTGTDSLDLSKSHQNEDERRQKLENYSEYRRKIIHSENDPSKAPNSKEKVQQDSGTDSNEEFLVPYTSAVEDKLDSEFASKLNETIKEGKIDSNISQSRVIQVITRGNFFQLINPKVKPKTFLVCMDFSPESIYALEWCLGTVLVDGSVLFIVCVIEENDNHHNLKANTLNESSREKYRINMLNKAKQHVLNLLKLTKLQIHIVIEIIHHPIPRHLILEIIDNLQPTLTVVGSKGQSAIKGVLLGSLSNYLVTKSSVPIMVVREKLKKINRFKSGSAVFANNIKPLTLSEARID
ncbi:Piso0_004244 [Millerozyma farinosa CBS 7064]|uniref:Piso0_004244 protein n=1 Tax=Pichia sorbitophila (strain ATCC MYA-4447 / BCRC 22081 / CBS 7064 / NBRC 10061 / NRRL Y-12695) TaxID=559304 RepID=G8Y7W0_PICSO|nr:Piso0_004244 [Millerozyma farinosa CBS 7064]CCE84690.1 Piso0_004244 [Millerozyma farinosa CBS 7064]